MCVWNPQKIALDVPGNLTDASTIVDTARAIDQIRGAPTDVSDTPPGRPQAPTMVTALDGVIMLSNISNSNSTNVPNGVGRRDSSDYELVFEGVVEKDAPIEGTAYLTYTLVSNSSYEDGLAECLDFCTNTDGCVFCNLYYELRNPLLDLQKSNLKCVVFGDVHTADEKTDYWNRQLSVQPNETISIVNSSGYASLASTELAAPEGYELVFGPISAANNAPGYMGFAFLDKYDESACAKLCDLREPDLVGGACKFFNIWRAVVYGKPKTYTCAMYYAPTDASTAENAGQGSLSVTLSRGYRRISHIADGGFEEYTCANDDGFCFDEKAPGWVGTSPAGGNDDATVFHYAPYAHMGASVGLLGCAFGRDPYPGTLTPAMLGKLLPGREYVVQFFHSSAYSGQELEGPSFVEVLWNGKVAGSVHVGYSPWRYFEFTVKALGGGNDTLQFKGGMAPAYDFIDDVYLFLLS
ncbi:Fruit-body specific protein a [Mycena venus]|uniref:Fruit-body specific protein a n=1 Tax=Mycena venus TaxID=2733690 RepID=A0A8H7D009_9AGAR|nr:Fruit-body specific protein a [Mycena venus]